MRQRPRSPGVSLCVLTLLATAPAFGQTPPPLPDLSTVEAWFSRACGVGRPADVAWAAAHTRVPMRRRDCGGEIRHCRTQRITRAARGVEDLCSHGVFETAREDGRPGWLGRQLVDDALQRFDVWRRQRRVILGGQFVFYLLFETAPDGQALWVGWRDE